MWRFLVIIAIAAVIADSNNSPSSTLSAAESFSAPTLSEYLTEKGVTEPDTFVVTAYLAVDARENRYHGITYSGVPARPFHTVAVDPKVIPIGTWLYIKGLGWWRAEDTGNMIKGNRLDICVPTRSEAMRWGKQPREVWIVTPENRRHHSKIETAMIQSGRAIDEI